jgi:hypothetical protein
MESNGAKRMTKNNAPVMYFDETDEWVDVPPSPPGEYETLATAIGRLTDEKARQYGNANVKVGEIMKVLYPEGVPVYALKNALLIVRMLDKICRIANQGPDGLDKGAEDPFSDLAGYSLIGAASNTRSGDK